MTSFDWAVSSLLLRLVIKLFSMYAGCVYNQNVGEMIQQTKGLKLAREEAFAAGLFRVFICQKTI